MFLSNSEACREQATLGWAHLDSLLRLPVPKLQTKSLKTWQLGLHKTCLHGQSKDSNCI